MYIDKLEARARQVCTEPHTWAYLLGRGSAEPSFSVLCFSSLALLSRLCRAHVLCAQNTTSQKYGDRPATSASIVQHNRMKHNKSVITLLKWYKNSYLYTQNKKLMLTFWNLHYKSNSTWFHNTFCLQSSHA